MKKPLACLLALALLLVPAAPAFADSPGDTSDVAIEANYVPHTDNRAAIEAGTSGIVYSFSISWNQTGTVTYSAGSTIYTWNQNTLQYDTSAGASGWTISNDASVVITITNRSNTAIKGNFSNPVGMNGVRSISGSYNKNTLNLSSAATGGFTAKGAEQSGSVTYTITGVDGTISSAGAIGRITVTITTP